MANTANPVSPEVLRDALIAANDTLLSSMEKLSQRTRSDLDSGNFPDIVNELLREIIQPVNEFIDRISAWQAQLQG